MKSTIGIGILAFLLAGTISCSTPEPGTNDGGIDSSSINNNNMNNMDTSTVQQDTLRFP